MRRNTEDNLENLKTYTRLATEADTTAEASDQYVMPIFGNDLRAILIGYLQDFGLDQVNSQQRHLARSFDHYKRWRSNTY